MGGEVGLRRADDSGKSFISIHNGLEEDFAELLGRKVSLKIQSFSNHYVVAFRLSVWETEGASEICFPVTFYLEKTVKNTEAITDTYQFYGSLQYKVTVRTPQKGTTSFLIQPEKVSRSIVLPM